MKVVVINHLTLDGVMQAPGRAEEDTRGGFQHGGWASGNNDPVMDQAWGARLGHSGGLLLGRRTYEDVLGYWNSRPGNPFVDALNNAPKFVASTTLVDPLPWPNSTLLGGDVLHAVFELRQQPGNDLHIMGSGNLIQTLTRHDLIDEYMLSIHPLVVGAGHRLFPDGAPSFAFDLVDCRATTKGVVIVTYRPSRRPDPLSPSER